MNPKNEHNNGGGGDTSPALLDHLLDRNPKRKNGKPGSYRMRLLLVDKKNLVGRKLRLGLRTGKLSEARQRAWIAVSALRNAGVQLGNIVLDAEGRRVDLNTVEPPSNEAFETAQPSKSANSTRKRARDEEEGQGVFAFFKRAFRSRKKA